MGTVERDLRQSSESIQTAPRAAFLLCRARILPERLKQLSPGQPMQRPVEGPVRCEHPTIGVRLHAPRERVAMEGQNALLLESHGGFQNLKL